MHSAHAVSRHSSAADRAAHQTVHNGFWNGLLQLRADVRDVGTDMHRDLAHVLIGGRAVLHGLLHLCEQ